MEKSDNNKNILSSISDCFPKIEWAPLWGIPLERRMQTAAVVVWLILLGSCMSLSIFSLTLPVLWPIHIAYLAYLWIDQSHENGGRRSEWFRSLPFWHYFAGYFPVKIVKVKEKEWAFLLYI